MPDSDALLGVLRPVDGSEPIPLPEAHLTSREGLILGRSSELCHVEVRDSRVSRRHVRLRATGGTILVEDLNSLEGTQVAGSKLKPFEPERIMSGQSLNIAGLQYRLQHKVEHRFRT